MKYSLVFFVFSLFLSFACGETDECGAFPKQQHYAVLVTQRAAAPDGASLISFANGSTAFNFSFTTAWFPSGSEDGLIVRVVECNPDHHSCAGVAHPEWTNAGALAVVRATLPTSGPLSAERITPASVDGDGRAAQGERIAVGIRGSTRCLSGGDGRGLRDVRQLHTGVGSRCGEQVCACACVRVCGGCGARVDAQMCVRMGVREKVKRESAI